MSEDTKYNGWNNYETWLCNLWIDNDEGSSNYWQEQAEEAMRQAIDNPSEYDFMDIRDEACRLLSDMLKSEIEEGMPTGDSGLYADLLNAAVSSIDFREIADHMISDIKLYSAVYNMPGCLPEMTPATFTDEDEAWQFLADELRSHADGDESITDEEVEKLAEDLESHNSIEYDGYFYSVNEV